jgi:hypothetical protein
LIATILADYYIVLNDSDRVFYQQQHKHKHKHKQATMMLNAENVVFSDNVFTANESCMGYHVTFVENFAINIHNATNYKFRVTQSLVEFEIKVCSNDSKAMNSGYICVSIQLVTSQQESLRLRAVFNVKNRHGGWFECNDTWSILSVSDAQILQTDVYKRYKVQRSSSE